MRRRLSLAILAGLLSLTLAPMAAFAVNPDEVLADPVLEGRAREISAQLRCMVCQNQSIDDSNAELAKDLRVLVRERLTNGDSDQDVINYVVSRYGEFVLLNPRLSWKTYLLWGAPAALLVVGGIAMAVYTRQRQPGGGDRLTEQEEARLQALLSESSDERRP